MYNVIQQLNAGDHVALFYRSRAEQFRSLVPYIQIGLERRERCLYIADDNSVAIVLHELKLGGIDVEKAQASGALVVTTKQDTYLRHGVFEPAKMIDGLASEVTASLQAGYTAFRATGEMSWALALPSALARLTEYELELHEQYPNAFMGLCQYNETLFPERIISDMVRIHPKVIARDKLFRNALYSPQEVRGSDGVRVCIDELINASAPIMDEVTGQVAMGSQRDLRQMR